MRCNQGALSPSEPLGMSVASPVKNLRQSVVQQLGDILPPRQGWWRWWHSAPGLLRQEQRRLLGPAESWAAGCTHRTGATALSGRRVGCWWRVPPAQAGREWPRRAHPSPRPGALAQGGGRLCSWPPLLVPSSAGRWGAFSHALRHALGTVTSVGWEAMGQRMRLSRQLPAPKTGLGFGWWKEQDGGALYGPYRPPPAECLRASLPSASHPVGLEVLLWPLGEAAESAVSQG